MFKWRKMIATFIAGIMMAGMTVSANVNTAVTAKNEEAVLALKAFGIMVGDKDTGEYRENDPIKRSEFAKVAIHTLGIEDIAIKSADTRFTDVGAEHWASGYINVASQHGLIVGDPDGKFRPDDSISYAEAMTILVRMTGYEPSAKAKGGYPGGYILVGAENSIGDKVTVSNAGEAVTRGMVAQMTFNALTVKLMEQTGFGNNEDYTISEKTLLKDKLGVEKTSGVLTADGNTALDGTSSVDKDSAKVADSTFAKGEINASHYLGQNVNAYALENEETEEMTLILVYPTNKNTVLKVDADKIEELSAEKAEFWKEDAKNITTVDFSENLTFIYNGKADSMENIAIPESGNVVFLDNNNDGEADVLFVNEYRNVVVADKSDVSYKVSDLYGNSPLVLDFEDQDKNITLTDVGGNKVQFKDITEWDVLCAAESRDGKLLTVTLSRNAITGKVTEKVDEKFVIDGKEYEMAENCTETIELGDEATFCLDVDGKIAAVNNRGLYSGNYAYLIGAEQTKGIDKELNLKLFTAKGEMLVLKGADKIKVDEATGKAGEQVIELLKDGAAEVERQLISYSLNASGEINEIDRALDKSGESLASYKGEFVKNAVITEGEYTAASGKIGGINIDEKTLVFVIPGEDEEEFEIRNKDMFENGASYNLSVYDMEEDMTAKVVMVTNSQSEASAENPLLVVSKVTKASGENGTVMKIYGLCDGKEAALQGSEDFSASLNKGDVIVYRTNQKGEVDGITKLLDVEDKASEFKEDISEEVTVVYGKVEKKFADSVNVTVNGGVAENYKITGATVYKYDSGKNNGAVQLAAGADIQRYDEAAPERVFIKLLGGQAKEIVIIK